MVSPEQQNADLTIGGVNGDHHFLDTFVELLAEFVDEGIRWRPDSWERGSGCN
jgi:hypothetical protein